MAANVGSNFSQSDDLGSRTDAFVGQNHVDSSHIPDYSAFEDGTPQNSNGVQKAEDLIQESDSTVSTFFRHDDSDVSWSRPAINPSTNPASTDATTVSKAASGSRLMQSGFTYDPNESFSNYFDKSLSIGAPVNSQTVNPQAQTQPGTYVNPTANSNGVAPNAYGMYKNYPNGSAAPTPNLTNASNPGMYGLQQPAQIPANTNQYMNQYANTNSNGSRYDAQTSQPQYGTAPQPVPQAQTTYPQAAYGYSQAARTTNQSNGANSSGQYGTPPPPQQQQQQLQQQQQQQPQVRQIQANSFASSGSRDRNSNEYDLQSESIQLPGPDGIEQLVAQPAHEPYSNKHQVNCAPDIMRCTLRAVPSTKELLSKSRLPFGVVLHPFKDVQQLAVLQVSNIVRCKTCRTYINPFASFIDNRRWRCNVCQRANELPEDFLYDPATRTYGDVFVRPEVRSATVEYIAPAEYAVRPPQPAVFVFVLDVTPATLGTDYLTAFCTVLRDSLERLPGDARKQMAFITYDSAVHFYSFKPSSSTSKQTSGSSVTNGSDGTAAATNDSEPRKLFRMHVCADLDDLTAPLPPDALLINVNNNRETIREFLTALPDFWNVASSKRSNASTAGASLDQRNSLGSALTLAHKLISSVGGRITVVNGTLPNVGIAALQPREAEFRKSPSFTTDTPSGLLSPAVDAYKRLGLECSTAQIGIDVFALGAVDYMDLASFAPAARYSAGSVYYYALAGRSKAAIAAQLRKFEADMKRYLVRKLGFEAVLRIRCTKGISIQNFYGNFFVRATDLCNLANVSPDLGCAAHLRIDEALSDYSNVTVQCAILYTHAAGERRIRVHTMCIPITDQVSEVLMSADQQSIVALLARMASERAVTRSLADAREGLIASVVDVLNALRSNHMSQFGGLNAPHSLRLFALYVLGLLKGNAVKPGVASIDERVYALEQLRQLPAQYLILKIYPALYCLDVCEDGGFLSRELDLTNSIGAQSTSSAGSLSLSASAVAPTYPPLVRLCSRNVSVSSVYLLDCGDALFLYVGDRVRPSMLQQLFGVESITGQQCADMTDLPALNNLASNYVRRFIQHLRNRRAFGVAFRIIKEDPHRLTFLTQFLVEDRNEAASAESNLSYLDFLAHVREQLK